MRHEFHPDARLEFRESAAFYEACRPGLGVAFANEIESVLRTIIGLPTDGRLSKRMFADVWPAVFHTAFFYTIETDCILVVAVMHCSRKPGYWRGRLP
jgi:plasmid stabilization system protein ParE